MLAELEARGAALCDVLTDPAARQDIQNKLAQVVRQYNNLQKKLDHKKAEQEGALRDGRQLEESVSRTLGWVQGALSDLAGRLLVSADRDKLRQQLERHAPAYREAMAKEHEVIMLLNKGREMENKPAHPNLRKELDRIQQQWEKLRREVMDRQTRLETALVCIIEIECLLCDFVQINNVCEQFCRSIAASILRLKNNSCRG